MFSKPINENLFKKEYELERSYNMKRKKPIEAKEFIKKESRFNGKRKG